MAASPAPGKEFPHRRFSWVYCLRRGPTDTVTTMSQLKSFLVQLATDPGRFADFLGDRDKVLEAADLTAEEREILLSADPDRIYAALTQGNKSY